MTATDELRRLLDERGVEWRDDSSIYGTRRTVWTADGVTFVAAEVSGRLKVSGYLTPEQAIAATLGPETCHDDGDPGDFCCSECGVRMFTEANDTYTMIASDERTIIKRPNYCPNCGKRVVEEDA